MPQHQMLNTEMSQSLTVCCCMMKALTKEEWKFHMQVPCHRAILSGTVFQSAPIVHRVHAAEVKTVARQDLVARFDRTDYERFLFNFFTLNKCSIMCSIEAMLRSRKSQIMNYVLQVCFTVILQAG